MSDGDRLPDDVSEVLATWATAPAPAGFADRVLAAVHPPRRRVRRRWIAGALALAAVAAAALLVGRPDGTASIGARVVHDREAIAIGARGVAVAEPGTELTWTVAPGGAAQANQIRGDVFYRVERGGPFVVETPYGEVVVRGTCFRVEVLDMKISKQTWVGATVGAAVAALVVITVYEGGVRVVNAHGHTDASAGERVALGAGAPPARLPEPTVALEPPPATATVADLLQRDESHRGEIAALRARVRALETAPSPEAAKVEDHRDGKRRMLDLTQPELAEMAKNCEVRLDVPGYGAEPHLMSDKLAEMEQLSPAERATYDRIVREENGPYMTALRALYRELGGDGGDSLDPHAIMSEILQKSPAADVEAARKQIAQERAGIVAPPADLRGRSVVERLFRLQMSASDRLEQRLGDELGIAKAHQIRTIGWAGGDDSILSGC